MSEEMANAGSGAISMVKAHPIAFGVGALVIVLLVAKSGGSSTASNAGAVVQAAGIQSASNVQLAQIGAQSSAASGAVAADVAKTQAVAYAGTFTQSFQAAAQTIMTAIASNQALVTSQENLQLGLDTNAKSQTVALANTGAALTARLSDANTALQSYIVGAGVVSQKNTNDYLLGYQATDLAATVANNKTGSDNATALAITNALVAPQLITAKANANAANAKAGTDIFSSIFKAASAIFGL